MYNPLIQIAQWTFFKRIAYGTAGKPLFKPRYILIILMKHLIDLIKKCVKSGMSMIEQER